MLDENKETRQAKNLLQKLNYFMITSTKDSLSLYLHKKNLSDEEFQAISFLIKNENKDSILSKLKKDLIREYLNIAINN